MLSKGIRPRQSGVKSANPPDQAHDRKIAGINAQRAFTQFILERGKGTKMKMHRFTGKVLALTLLVSIMTAGYLYAEQKWGDPKPVVAPGNPTSIDYAAVRDGKRPHYPGWGDIFDKGKNPYMRRWEDAIVLETKGKWLDGRTPYLVHEKQMEEAKKKLAELEKKTGKKPNFLIVLLDDVGWMDLGFNGGGITVGSPTPQMDIVGKEGLILTSAYSQPSCSPSRATINTGRLPVRHGILIPPMYGMPGGLGGEITIAQLLKKAGYQTQAVGKWHMGANAASMPQAVGYDDFFGFMGVSDEYTEWRDWYYNPDLAVYDKSYLWAKNGLHDRCLVHGKTGMKEMKCVQEITLPVVKELDRMWMEYSQDFIRKMAKSDKPWFLYHCARGCHFDNYPSDDFVARSPARHPYTDCITEMDHIFGTLMKTLEETGQLENTMVILTSDNGPELETWPDCARTPFRLGKGSTWEGGQRVPFVVYWKGMIKGDKSDGLFDFADILPTFLTMAGRPDLLPKDRFIDGIDQTSFLLSDEGLSNRKYVFYWLQNNLSAMRTGQYKVMYMGEYMTSPHDTNNPGGFSGVNGYSSYAKFFNLYQDPKETHSYTIRKLPIASRFDKPLLGTVMSLWKWPSKLKAFTVHPQVDPLLGDVLNIDAFGKLKEKLKLMQFSPVGDLKAGVKDVKDFFEREEEALKKKLP